MWVSIKSIIQALKQSIGQAIKWSIIQAMPCFWPRLPDAVTHPRRCRRRRNPGGTLPSKAVPTPISTSVRRRGFPRYAARRDLDAWTMTLRLAQGSARFCFTRRNAQGIGDVNISALFSVFLFLFLIFGKVSCVCVVRFVGPEDVRFASLTFFQVHSSP